MPYVTIATDPVDVGRTGRVSLEAAAERAAGINVMTTATFKSVESSDPVATASGKPASFRRKSPPKPVEAVQPPTEPVDPPVSTVIESVAAISPAVQLDGKVGLPTARIELEFDGVPMRFPAKFHEIVITPQLIVLVWDRRCQLAEPIWPEATDQDTYLQIPSKPDRVYQVSSNGWRFPVQHLDLCVLPVLAASDVTED